jgi:hypothetical protein
MRNSSLVNINLESKSILCCLLPCNANRLKRKCYLHYLCFWLRIKLYIQ